MKRFFDGLKKAEEKLIAVLLAVMVIVIFAATIGRYTMLFSLPWAEELARYLMIWTVAVITALISSSPISPRSGKRSAMFYRTSPSPPSVFLSHITAC